MENTTQNQENQEQTSNHNEVDNQYKENLEKLKKGIEEIEEYKYTSENGKEELLSREFSTFISDNFPENKELAGFIDIISKTIKKYQKFAYKIINYVTQNFINKGKGVKDISNDISEIIKIINTDKIKNNQDLVFNIINGFVTGCLMKKPDNIEDIAKSFPNSLNGMEEEIKGKLKPIFSLIVSQYFINTLTDSSNKQLSKYNDPLSYFEDELDSIFFFPPNIL